MDPGTFAGIALALGCIFGSVFMEGGNPAAIIAPGALILVFGGTFGVAMASGLMKDATGIATDSGLGPMRFALMIPESQVAFANTGMQESAHTRDVPL